MTSEGPLTCLKHVGYIFASVKDKLIHLASDNIKERVITFNRPHWIMKSTYNIGVFLWFIYKVTSMASSFEWDLGPEKARQSQFH